MDISGVDSAQLPLALAIGSLVNGASWQSGPVGPNTILTLFYRSPPGVQSLQVLIDGQGAEILYSGPTQLNFVIPPTAIPKASALLQISSSGNLLVATPLQIVDASPALFTVNQSGTGQASVLNQDYTRNGTAAPGSAWIDRDGVRNRLWRRKAPRTGRAFLARRGSQRYHRRTSRGGDLRRAGARIYFRPPADQHSHSDDCPTGAGVSIRLQLGGNSTQLGTTIAVE